MNQGDGDGGFAVMKLPVQLGCIEGGSGCFSAVWRAGECGGAALGRLMPVCCYSAMSTNPIRCARGILEFFMSLFGQCSVCMEVER